MVLVDTNVIIDYWDNPDENITKIFANETIAICGIVQAELLHGANSQKDIDNIEKAIACFRILPYRNDWKHLGVMLYELRKSGLTMPVTDVMIAQICIENNVSILTNDKHFAMMQKCLPKLNIYQVNP